MATSNSDEGRTARKITTCHKCTLCGGRVDGDVISTSAGDRRLHTRLHCQCEECGNEETANVVYDKYEGISGYGHTVRITGDAA